MKLYHFHFLIAESKLQGPWITKRKRAVSGPTQSNKPRTNCSPPSFPLSISPFPLLYFDNDKDNDNKQLTSTCQALGLLFHLLISMNPDHNSLTWITTILSILQMGRLKLREAVTCSRL